MYNYKRLFIVGHPGAGKAFLAKTLAKKLGWRFVNSDFDLEIRTGKAIHDLLGDHGTNTLFNTFLNILSAQCCNENIVVTTDPAIVCYEKNRQLLTRELVVNLKVSVPIQLERITANPAPLLPDIDLKCFFEKLHHDRDKLYRQVSTVEINSDDSALEKHVLKIHSLITDNVVYSDPITENVQEIIIFHKVLHTPVHISGKHASCLMLLAEGKSSKEIGEILHISHRTVEDYLAKNMELLGCSSSKELIALYHDQP